MEKAAWVALFLALAATSPALGMETGEAMTNEECTTLLNATMNWLAEPLLAAISASQMANSTADEPLDVYATISYSDAVKAASLMGLDAEAGLPALSLSAAARSCRTKIQNNSPKDLVLISSEDVHGCWADGSPVNRIAAGASAEILIESCGFMTGAESKLKYQMDGFSGDNGVLSLECAVPFGGRDHFPNQFRQVFPTFPSATGMSCNAASNDFCSGHSTSSQACLDNICNSGADCRGSDPSVHYELQCSASTTTAGR